MKFPGVRISITDCLNRITLIRLAKSKPTASRNIKRELETGEQHQNEFDDLEGSQNGESVSAKTEMHPDAEDAEDDDDDFSHDGYSHSINSMQSTSLPPTPEPRNETPTLHTTRPSSKSSAFSVASQNSGQITTSSPTPQRKSASCLQVNVTFSFWPSITNASILNDIPNFPTIPLQNATVTSGKYIPCLISDSAVSQSSTANSDELAPESWTISDVEQFLRTNDCNIHSETFSRNKVDGKRLLEITDDEVFRMLDGKTGPALKIQHLIRKLREKMDKLKPSRHSTGKSSAAKKYL